MALGLAAVLPVSAACTSEDSEDSEDADKKGGGKRAPGTLRILASSELTDMKPVLDAAREATGVTVEATWSGTQDAVERVASGKADGAYEAIWLSSNDYLRLRPETAKKITSETPVMTSPVALGVKADVVRRLGWHPDQVTWARIHQAVADGKLTYGMTDPVRSNSGFSALISIASGLSGAQSALRDADVRKVTPKLKEFFAGQKLTSGSSGWLAQAYTRRGDVDALINYESVLLSLNRDHHTGLTVIRPQDGVVTADYPLTALASAPQDARDSVRALTEYLRSTEAQRMLTERTFRRPVVTSVRPAAPLSAAKRRELPFPGTRSVADGLLAAYENELRRPSRTVYVLDTSGSMEGDRLDRLKTALTQLAGADGAATGERFRDREEVTLMPFGSEVKAVRTHTVPEADPGKALGAIRADAKALTADGETAIFSSLREAYRHLAERASALGDDRFTSIVLMTDGENTAGDSADDFESFYRRLPGAQRTTPVFPILFGDSDRGELENIASLTGGRLFDATKSSLDQAFEEIRGYQ
ncbi:substrate-binding and VWA domain-containing protein [Streptomyces sp. NBS 14/10]|uniref:substrate-binding and vWA domain-containing protein n=1 Tax=Streptomyces sp. NBS 14/10 TaxID=1945643 RepID=UPI000B7EAA84|nr:substrate-binding and VWA domain-containing protein [Streptomyces sp. NBS 14/10]KAK1186215.1 substrate-binding and VWA domain-containing protein [Streptomyces sp. NBS 14/10]NUS85261.1 VWA domain-containing protein [Streptomyces sp.]